MELQMPELQKKTSACVWLALKSDKKADGCFDLFCNDYCLMIRSIEDLEEMRL